MKLAFIGLAFIISPILIVCTDNGNLEERVNNRTDILLVSTSPKTTEILLYRVIGKLKKFFNQNNENNFTGRCIQLAKKIRSLIPFAIFGAGVIITLLGFLTMFSIKSLGLLILLLLINASSAVAKITAAFVHKGDKQPSTVHYHVNKYNDDHHGYHVGHDSYDHDWDRKTRINEEIMELDRLESYNLYNKLLNNLASKNYRII
ncbi:uncharacterized protein LOC130445926 [Diorhabda sublineata]|uniref:uncharacterized protein LOC130445926 n=1 Tax=Diorhabda sublineata TaxID=1163346 RepID=UPI0024E0E748|nr:uncharacterized protein LOC130445926 [Diorhabda sublineata]